MQQSKARQRFWWRAADPIPLRSPTVSDRLAHTNDPFGRDPAPVPAPVPIEQHDVSTGAQAEDQGPVDALQNEDGFGHGETSAARSPVHPLDDASARGEPGAGFVDVRARPGPVPEAPPVAANPNVAPQAQAEPPPVLVVPEIRTQARPDVWPMVEPVPTAEAAGSMPGRLRGMARRNVGPALAALLIGAVMFTGISHSIGGARLPEPISQQLDRLFATVGFGIDEVSIAGLHNATDRNVHAAVNAGGARSLVMLDVEATRRRIEALPWIERVVVRRVLPSKLEVSVLERQPAAVWVDNGAWSLIDFSGRVLAPASANTRPDLLRLAGAGAPEAAAELISVLDRHRDLAEKVDTFRRIGGRSWQLELPNGTRILLGTGPLDRSFARLAAVVRQRPLFALPGHLVDMRAGNVISIRKFTGGGPRRAGTSGPTPARTL